ncbi:predicted protein [Phaeodactylum tricornutum CCAP 1055/1]|jgi:hypothetical protein|uniref:Uncharacterized protein n=1 Tax=Phaeodactylum tricornutum (strain CCAP 1055/1) TaxID=556484 RepID=B7GD20_PHATC|nr:predicted protein [Phaeodactylum tricornutum CCAP 1055/1]EEC43420.1 predicted protein [Phaeodactylum tricornutum CCAP 1055/1]|eukprot:XP_002184973.1 predicted protein [Phaeodactylum tricornutum CCAP 1055/1]
MPFPGQRRRQNSNNSGGGRVRIARNGGKAGHESHGASRASLNTFWNRLDEAQFEAQPAGANPVHVREKTATLGQRMLGRSDSATDKKLQVKAVTGSRSNRSRQYSSDGRGAPPRQLVVRQYSSERLLPNERQAQTIMNDPGSFWAPVTREELQQIEETRAHRNDAKTESITIPSPVAEEHTNVEATHDVHVTEVQAPHEKDQVSDYEHSEDDDDSVVSLVTSQQVAVVAAPVVPSTRTRTVVAAPSKKRGIFASLRRNKLSSGSKVVLQT